MPVPSVQATTEHRERFPTISDYAVGPVDEPVGVVQDLEGPADQAVVLASVTQLLHRKHMNTDPEAIKPVLAEGDTLTQQVTL